MTEVTTIGLYLAKKAFQVHGVDAAGAVTVRRQQVLAFFAKLPPVSGRNGGMRDGALLGARDRQAWPRCADPAGLCEDLCPPQHERPNQRLSSRRPTTGPVGRGDLRGGKPAVDALCRGQDRDAQAAAGIRKVREMLVRQRTMLINTLRGLMAEFGIVVAE
jgi:transposase